MLGRSDSCSHTSERDESFFALQLDVKGKRSVLESLDAFVQGEMLDGDNRYWCEECGKHVEALKRCCVKSLPRTLILHLKRFEFDYDQMKKVKVGAKSRAAARGRSAEPRTSTVARQGPPGTVRCAPRGLMPPQHPTPHLTAPHPPRAPGRAPRRPASPHR